MIDTIYIKMCKKATEIQELWWSENSPFPGDIYIDDKGDD